MYLTQLPKPRQVLDQGRRQGSNELQPELFVAGHGHLFLQVSHVCICRGLSGSARFDRALCSLQGRPCVAVAAPQEAPEHAVEVLGPPLVTAAGACESSVMRLKQCDQIGQVMAIRFGSMHVVEALSSALSDVTTAAADACKSSAMETNSERSGICRALSTF